MEAQHNEGEFDGVEASVEYPVEGGTAKARLRMGGESVLIVVLGAVLVLDKADALERLLKAAPALAGRVGNRLAAAA
jgi:hypothetical protein